MGIDKHRGSLELANQKYFMHTLEKNVARQDEHKDMSKHYASPSFIVANSLTLPHRSNLFDIIIVDPPWGHRHGKHHTVMKNQFRWMNEWVRVLKVGGLLGMVTIRTKQVLHDYNIHFSQGRGLELIEQLQFNNSGVRQCCYFVFKKVLK